MTEAPRHFGFLLLPRFSLMPLASAIEPLRMANRLAGRTHYSWETAGMAEGVIEASNGSAIHVAGLPGGTLPTGAVIVCGGLDIRRNASRDLTERLRGWARRGTILGSLCTGSYVLAKAGLLDGYRATVHWEEAEALADEFPDVDFAGTLFEIDRDRMTCSGGTAPLDMMIELISADLGRDLAYEVADQMLHYGQRHAGEPQRVQLAERTGVRHPDLLTAIAVMEANLEAPLPLGAVAARAKRSIRQMERLFAAHLRQTPAGYYLDLRLKRARQLVRQTGMPLVEVAVATGFSSASHFGRAYRQRFAITPSRDRRAGG